MKKVLFLARYVFLEGGAGESIERRVRGAVARLWETGASKLGLTRSEVKKVRESGSGLIAEKRLGKAVSLAYFPQPDHAEVFLKSFLGGHIELEGLAEEFPGAVGGLYGIRGARGSGKKSQFDIRIIQGFFRQKKPGMPRKIATKYGGWREHLLRELFARLGRIRIRVVTMPKVRLYGGRTPEILAKIAGEHGFEEAHTEREWVFRKKG